MPFSRDEFLDVFQSYNAALWPVALLLWIASAGVVAGVLTRASPRIEALTGLLLTVLWGWGALAYHAAYFTAVNPAAWAFASLFVIEAILVFVFGVLRGRLSFGSARGPVAAVGAGLALFALAYPVVCLVFGETYPRMPTFGVPCPTAILTTGLLLTCRQAPSVVAVAPFVWSLIGGAGAVLLGVAADYVLLACASLIAGQALVSGLHRTTAARRDAA